MRKVIVLTSVLALGAGSALAQDFQVSDSDSAPTVYRNAPVNVDRSVVTSSVGEVGFSAAQGFGPSDENDNPTPRYQHVR